MVIRAEALGHRADERRAPRAGDFGRDVVHAHDDDPADAAELDVTGADGTPHVAAFELGYGMLDNRDPFDGEALPIVTLSRADADRETGRCLALHVMENAVDAVSQQGRHERVVARADVLAKAYICLVVIV